MVNKTLASLPSLKLDLTSYNLFPIGLTVGIPTGHPNSTVFMFSPRIFRFDGERLSIQSLTGIFPLSFLKKYAVNIFSVSAMMIKYQFRYILSSSLMKKKSVTAKILMQTGAGHANILTLQNYQ